MDMQNSLFGDIPKPETNLYGDDECVMSDQELIECLEADLESEAEYSDELFSHLALAFDFIGQMVVNLHQKTVDAEKPSIDSMLKSVDSLFTSMSQTQRGVVRRAVEFHYYADRRTQPSTKNRINWRDHFELNGLADVDFNKVIDSYYSAQ